MRRVGLTVKQRAAAVSTLAGICERFFVTFLGVFWQSLKALAFWVQGSSAEGRLGGGMGTKRGEG